MKQKSPPASQQDVPANPTCSPSAAGARQTRSDQPRHSEQILRGRPLYVPPISLTEGTFCDWIAGAQVGHAIQYHEGLLLCDRSEVNSGYPTKERSRIHAVARRAWIACELGLVHLFSQRVESNHYRYLAIRSSTTLRPPEIRTRLRTVQPAPRNPH